jgi:hypothetical protein
LSAWRTSVVLPSIGRGFGFETSLIRTFATIIIFPASSPKSQRPTKKSICNQADNCRADYAGATFAGGAACVAAVVGCGHFRFPKSKKERKRGVSAAMPFVP